MSDSFCAHAEEAALILANLDLNGTLGIAYLGAVISCMYVPHLISASGAPLNAGLFWGGYMARIYGVTCIQTFHYFRSHQSKTDGWHLRSVVGIVVLVVSVDYAHDLVSLGCVPSVLRISAVVAPKSCLTHFAQVSGHGPPGYHCSSSLLLCHHELLQSVRTPEGFMVRLHVYS